MHGFPRKSAALRSLLAPILVTTVLASSPGVALAQCTSNGSETGALVADLVAIAADHDATVSVSVTRGGTIVSGEVSVSSESCGFTTVTVSGDIARGGSLSVNWGIAGAEVEAAAGMRTTFEVTLPDASFDSFTVPDPFDPRTLPPGSTLILSEEWFASAGASAAFRGLVASIEGEVAAGSVVAITRLPDGRVQLLVGPYEAVRATTMLGIGTLKVNAGLVADIEVEFGTVGVYTFDPATELGAFREALALGTLTGRGGTRPHDVVEYVSYTDERSLQLAIGEAALSFGVGNSGGVVRVIHHADGTTTYERTAVYELGTTTSIASTQTFDASGSPIGPGRVSATYIGDENLEWNAHLYNAAVGGESFTEPFRGRWPDGFTITLEGDDWKTWRDRAREVAAAMGGSAPPELLELAAVDSPDAMADFLFHHSLGSTMQTIATMLMIPPLRERTAPFQGLGGSVTPACDGVDSGDAPPADPVAQAASLAERWCGLNVDREAATLLTAAPAGGAKGAEGAGMLR